MRWVSPDCRVTNEAQDSAGQPEVGMAEGTGKAEKLGRMEILVPLAIAVVSVTEV